MNEPEPRPVTQHGLELKWNNLQCREHCALCDAEIRPEVGLAIFLADTHESVCDACAADRAPGLLTMRAAGHTFSRN